MNAYVCVYRQPIVKRSDWNKTKREALSTPGLEEYLRRYNARFRKGKKKLGYFYDWGDDPSFFAAEEFLCDVNKAGWGVCRPDVRGKLSRGDFIVFFCGQQQKADKRLWKYYYIGLGTVLEIIDRNCVWEEEQYASYSQFYNLLVDSEGNWKEVIYPCHCDWRKRADAPYVLFDTSPLKTHFNLVNPLLVATYRNKGAVDKGVMLEKWKLKNKRAKRINNLIPKRKGGKKLSTSWTGYGHSLMNLSKELKHDTRKLKNTRKALLKISNEIANR